jgi:hypothetical protein
LHFKKLLILCITLSVFHKFISRRIFNMRKNIIILRILIIFIFCLIIFNSVVYSQVERKPSAINEEKKDILDIVDNKITDPNQTRTFLLPTATTPDALQGYIGDIDIFYLTGILGITDNIMINAGFLVLPIGRNNIICDYGFKINLYDDHKFFSAGAGWQMLHLGDWGKIPGLGYGVITLGNSVNKLNLFGGAAYNLETLGSKNSSLLFGVSGLLHLTHQIQFMTETYFSPDWNFTPMILGFRIYSKAFTCDFGILFRSGNSVRGFQRFAIISFFYCP